MVIHLIIFVFQNLQTILISLENRLRNLDTIYSMQYSPSIEGKMERFARKLESLDTKIFRLETLISLQLDKISENISTKNFKDDITKTSWMRKIDAIYEGLYNRLTYMEGKFENNFARLNVKCVFKLWVINLDAGFYRKKWNQ